jgi:predicted nucleotide-binding protein (sugar kinase/HSP70/actin superfamily)
MLHQIVLERQAWRDRVSIWSPPDSDYFGELPPGSPVLLFAGCTTHDALQAGLYDTRPVETRAGAADEIYARYQEAILRRIEAAAGDLRGTAAALREVANGRLFGCRDLLGQAAVEYAGVKSARKVPTVLLVGEIYVRCDPAANDFLVESLEARGLAVRFAPFVEWLEYTDQGKYAKGGSVGWRTRISTLAQHRMLHQTYTIMAEALGWPARTTVKDSLAAANPWVREELRGEAVLTVGGPVREWRDGHIDAAVSVGPLECMPAKIAESQFYHVAEQEGLLCLNIPVNGDPVDPEIIDNFAFEVHQRHRANLHAMPHG